MIDTPNMREPVGPAQIQQILADIEWLKDMVRSQRPMPSPTVRPNVTASGTTWEASAPAQQQETTTRQVWL
jgi:hypothetical protein